MTKIKFTATIDPLPQPRPRFAKGHAYNGDRATAHYRYEVKQAAITAMAGAEPFNGAIACTLRFYRRFNPTAQRFGDVDNLAKSTLDALHGTAYRNDSQVTSCFIQKFTDAENPRVEVEISAAS